MNKILRFSLLILLFTTSLLADERFGKIPNSLMLSSSESVRRNSADSAFEAFTPLDTTTASSTYVPYTGANANVNLGTAYNLNAKALTALGTTEQLRTSYDASNYCSVTTSSVGGTTFNAVGTTPTFAFTDSTTFSTAASTNNATFNKSHNSTSFLSNLAVSTSSPTSGANLNLYGTNSTFTIANSAGNITNSNLFALYNQITKTQAFNVSTAVATQSRITQASAGGSITNAVLFSGEYAVDASTAAVTNLYGYRMSPFVGAGSSTVTNFYGVHLGSLKGIGVTNAYGIYQDGANDFNYFAGNVGVGVISPTAELHLKAGTATASTAPLKFTSGALNTTAEVGAEEFLTDKRYTTITTGAARKEYTLNDIALTSGRIPFTTTNGRLTDSANLTFSGANLVASGTLTGSNLSGTNTGDQTITLTGNVTGSGTGSFATTIANDAVTNTKILNGAVTAAKIENQAALSVMGRSANTVGTQGAITAGTDNQVLRRSGTNLLFGAVNIASSNAVTGVLPVVNGGTGLNNATIEFGTYTPTVTAGTNIAATTAFSGQYMRIGSVVTVSGFVEVDPTAVGNSIWYHSLPIASNLGATEHLGGTFTSATNGNFGGVYADGAGDRALFRFNSTTTANAGYHFSYTYRII